MMTERKFHHGNLRSALIDLAIADLRQRPFGDLSLRDLAVRLGVSTGAPYRHFSSKDALLRAVAAEGHARVLEKYRAAEMLDAAASEKLRIACEAYIEFAFDNPGLFDLLFFTQIYAGRPGEPAHEGNSAFAVFERLVAAGRGLDDPARIRPAALAVWSLLHGFATLHAHSQLDHIMAESAMRQSIVAAACAIA